jgi:membrane protein implicated in regulation of membrane protease activity
MELYGNFKRWGVVIGFFLLGWLISIWDIRCGQGLRKGDWINYSCYFILLVPLLQPGGSAVELFSGTASAAVLVWFLQKFVFKEEKKQKNQGMELQEAEIVPVGERPRRFVYGKNKK